MRAAASRPLAPPDLTHGSRPDITGGQRQPLDLVPGEEAWHQWQEDFEPQLPGQLDIPDVEQVHAGLQQEGRAREQQEEIARLEEEVRMLQVRVGELSGGNQQLQESLTKGRDEEVVREFHMKLIRKFVNSSLDEMASLKMEVEMLQHMARMKAGKVMMESEPQPARKLKPIVTIRCFGDKFFSIRLIY